MLYLMIINRSHEVIKIMGHDVKQFKSLEGFLESGPQFILQSYILLRGEKLGYEDLTSVEASEYFRALSNSEHSGFFLKFFSTQFGRSKTSSSFCLEIYRDRL